MKTIAVLFSILFSTSSFLAQETQATGPVGQISVQGEASIDLPTDYVKIQISVNNTDKSAREAHALTTKQMSEALKLLKAEKTVSDIQTTQVSVRNSSGYKASEMSFMANQSLSFHLNDIAQYDRLMLSLFDNGVKNIGSVQFKSSQTKSVEEELMAKALMDAKHKAVLMAGVYNQKLGKAISISEFQEGAGPRPMAYASFEKSSSAGPSISEGTVTITKRIYVQFELK